MTKRIALFGDSILKGIILGDDNRYHISKKVDWAHIEEKLDIEIVNCSKMGLCIKAGREKLEKFLNEHPEIDTIVLEYGGNDSDYAWDKVASNPLGVNSPKTDFTLFGENLKSMVNMIKSYNKKPVLMTLPPIIADKYFDFIVSLGNDKENIKTFLGDIQVIYRRQEMYSNEISKVARLTNVDLVDVRHMFLQSDNMENLYCQDGIHPNCDGQKLIMKAFLEYYGQN